MQKIIKRGFGQKSQASFALIQCILLCNQLLWRKCQSKSWKCGCYLESSLSGAIQWVLMLSGHVESFQSDYYQSQIMPLTVTS